jgi:hypothetical protein
MAARPATKPTSRSTASAPKRATEQREASLRVVRTPERVRSVGAMGSLFALFVFATLFALAALHAVLVQTQARIDGLDRENAELGELLNTRLADEAWIDSPDGLREAALGAGLVEAPDVVALVPVPDGLLAPPTSADPFRPEAAG